MPKSEDPIQVHLTVHGHPGQPSLTFHPGQEVTGVVQLNAEKEVCVLGIRVAILGGAAVEVTHSHLQRVYGARVRRRYKHYTGKETYVNSEEVLLGDFENHTKVYAGVTNLPFKFTLPASSLPSSYEGVHGIVEYKVEVVIKNLQGQGDTTASQEIKMDSSFPLSRVNSPMTKAGTEVISGYCCCTGGPLEVIVKTDKFGYDVAGDVIELEVSVHNDSGGKVKDVTAEIMSSTTYFADGYSVTAPTEFPETRIRWGKGVPKRSEGFWTTTIPIPTLPPLRPTHLGGGCSVIDLKWKIQVIAEVEGWGNKQVSVSCPIILGTPLAKIASRRSINIQRAKQ